MRQLLLNYITLQPLLLVLLLTSTESHRLENMPGIDRDVVARGREIIPALPYGITENGSYVYSVCEPTDYSFTRKLCNVTVEKPIFADASFASTCPLRIEHSEGQNVTLSIFFTYIFGEDKLAISWLQDGEIKSWKLQILTLPTCEIVNVPISSRDIGYVVAYETVLEVVLSDANFCRSPACKITVDARGRVIAGPTAVATDVKFELLYGIVAVSTKSPDKGFYASMVLEEKNKFKHEEHFCHVNPAGKTVEFGQASVDVQRYAGFSNSHDYFAVCQANKNADFSVVTCNQYDSSLKSTINATMEFQDKDMSRWMQPHNLEDGGMLLVTGRSRDSQGTHYDRFKVFSIDREGRKGGPLRVRRLNMECKWLKGLRVRVIESEDGQICFYFVCGRGNDYESTLKYSSKCLSKSYFLVNKSRELSAN